MNKNIICIAAHKILKITNNKVLNKTMYVTIIPGRYAARICNNNVTKTHKYGRWGLS